MLNLEQIKRLTDFVCFYGNGIVTLEYTEDDAPVTTDSPTEHLPPCKKTDDLGQPLGILGAYALAQEVSGQRGEKYSLITAKTTHRNGLAIADLLKSGCVLNNGLLVAETFPAGGTYISICREPRYPQLVNKNFDLGSHAAFPTASSIKYNGEDVAGILQKLGVIEQGASIKSSQGPETITNKGISAICTSKMDIPNVELFSLKTTSNEMFVVLEKEAERRPGSWYNW